MEIRYPATFEPQDGGGFFVQFVDLPDTFTEGATLEEAQFNASEALSAMLGFKLDAGEAIAPSTADVAGAQYIAPDAKTQAAYLIRQARADRSLSELARALETSWPAARKLEDPKHWPSLRQLERAAAALGKRLVLSLE